MTQTINIPGIDDTLQFPDNMSDADIQAAIHKAYPQLGPIPQKKSILDKGVDVVDAFMDSMGNAIPGVSKMPNTWGGDEAAAKKYSDTNIANHPAASIAGNIAGSTLPYLAVPEVALPAKMAISGGIGAAQGANNGLNDDDTTNQVLAKIAEGGLAGAAGEGIAKGVGNLAEYFAPGVAGAQKSILKQMTPSVREKLGHYLLNAPEDGSQVIHPFNSTDSMIDRNNANMGMAKNTKNDAINSASDAGNTVDMTNVLDKINGLYPPVSKAPIYGAQTGAVNDAVTDALEHAAQQGDNAGNLSLNDADTLRGEYGQAANWSPSDQAAAQSNQVKKNVYGIYKQGIENNILPEDLSSYQDANATLANAMNAKAALTNRDAAEQGRDIFGLAPKIAIASGDPLAAAAGVGVELANRRGASGAVWLADQLGNKIPSLGALPQGISAINDYISQNQPGSQAQQGDSQ